MAPDMEKPPVTEIKVRMDCNGCVQKIKKALQGVPGIYDIHVDFSEQKVTITGWAEPEKLVKAIKKTRKGAVICVHTDQTEPPPEDETPPGEEAPPSDPTNPRADTPETEAASPPELPQMENPPPATSQHHHHPQRSNNHEEVHIVYHHPPQQGYGGPWNEYRVGPRFRNEGPYQPPELVYASSGPHANPYRASPHVSPAPHVNTYRPSLHVSPGFRDKGPYQPPQPMYMGSGPHTGPGFRDAPPQPPQSMYMGSGPGFRYGPPQPPQPMYMGSGQNTDPGFRDSPPQPPQPMYMGSGPNTGPGFRDAPPQPIYATHSYNTYNPSTYVTGYAYPPSPPKYSPNNSADIRRGAGLRDEGESSQPIYATNRYNAYRPSPYVSEYAYSESPPRYSSYSYNRDFYSAKNDNGNVTSMFSEENPNACRIV